MHRSTIVLLASACVLWGSALPAEITFGLNGESRIVINGNGDRTLGVQFSSRSGSLIPGPKGDAGPFQFLLQNAPSRVVYGSLGSEIDVDGSIVLPVGWNALGNPDVEIDYAISGTNNSAHLALFDQPPPKIDAVEITLSSDNQLILNGTGQQLDSIQFTSPTSSLSRATSSAPFATFTQNTDTSIEYIGSNVTVDGQVTLAAGWNRLVGVRDMSYRYTTTDGQAFGPFRVPGLVYPPLPPITRLGVHIDRTDPGLPIVLEGSGQEIRNLVVSSESGSLIPVATAGAFENIIESSPRRIELETTESILLDGSLSTNISYNHVIDGRDVQYQYDLVGNRRRFGTIRGYPSAPTTRPIHAVIDRNKGDHRIRLEGRGQRLQSVTFSSPTGSLIVGDHAGPFDSIRGTPETVTLRSTFPVLLDGSLTTGVHYNLDVAGEDITFEYELAGLVVPITGAIDGYPPNPLRSPLSMSINPDLSIELQGIGQPLSSISISSLEGTLRLSDTATPFITDVDTPNEVSLSLAAPLTIDRAVPLPVQWNEDAEDVQFTYRLDGVDRDFGPFRLRTINYPPPNLIHVIADPLVNSGMALVGSDQVILSLEMTSKSGALVPGPVGVSGPFDAVIENTDRRIVYTSTSGVNADFLVLPAQWSGQPDLEISFETVGRRATASVAYDVALPEPSGLLLMGVGLSLLRVRRVRQVPFRVL